MADPQQKLVKVDDDVVAFPSSMPDSHIGIALRNFRAQKKAKSLTTEQSEHERQLKPAQPLSSAIPTLPAWSTKPLVPGTDTSTPSGRLAAEASESFRESHPIAGGVTKGVSNFAEGLSSPLSVGLMLTAPQSKLLSAYFAYQAGKGAYKDAQEAQKAYSEGRNQDAAQYLTQAILGAGVAVAAGTHASYDAIRSPIAQSLADSLKTDIKAQKIRIFSIESLRIQRHLMRCVLGFQGAPQSRSRLFGMR